MIYNLKKSTGQSHDLVTVRHDKPVVWYRDYRVAYVVYVTYVWVLGHTT